MANNIVTLACRAGGTSVAFAYEILKNEMDVTLSWPFSEQFMDKFEAQAKDIFNRSVSALAQKILSQTQ